jgi:hypothetical protein
MLYGEFLLYIGFFVAISTLKGPAFLGGPRRRYASDESANAMMNRASTRSLGGWLIFVGGMMWLIGI